MMALKVGKLKISKRLPIEEQYPMLDKELKKKPNWVCLQNGRCINPKNGEEAFNDQSETWGTFAEACSYIEQHPDCILGYQLGFKGNVTALQISNCINRLGNFTNKKVEDIYSCWEESYAEVNPYGTGITFLFTGTPVSQKLKRTVTDGETEVKVSDYNDCVPITGRYCIYTEIDKQNKEKYDSEKSYEEFRLSSGQAVIDRTYELFFGEKKDKAESIKSDIEIDPTLSAINGYQDEKLRLSYLLLTNKYFNNLWHRTAPTGMGRAADEMNILARILKYVQSEEHTASLLFTASPYFKARPEIERGLYELLGSEFEYFADPKNPDLQSAAKRNFISPLMRRLLDKAELLAKQKNFGSYDNDIDILLDPIYETITDLDTDVRCANLLIKMYGNRMKYCTDDDCWYVFTDGYWKRESNKDLRNIRRFGAYIAKRLEIITTWYDMPDYKKRKLKRDLKRFGNVSSFKNILEAARGLKPVGSEAFNTKNEMLKIGNGTMNLETGYLEDDKADDMFTTYTDAMYYRSYPEPRRFLKFLNEIFLNDSDLIKYLHRVLGYCITGETKEQKFFVFYGKGKNGKSTLLNILQDVLNDYVGNLDAYALAKKNEGSGKGNPTLLQNRYSRMVIISEQNKDAELDIALIKAISGGDKISARMLFQNNAKPFKPRYKMVFATNYLPNIDWNNEGIKRRYTIIPFKNTIENVDPDLEAKIIHSEKDMILKWLIDGAVLYNKDRLGEEPEAVKEAFETAHKEKDEFYEYVEERIDRTEVYSDSIPATDLYNDYKKWCGDKDYKIVSQKEFGSRISKVLGNKSEILSTDPQRRRHYLGIIFKE